MTEDSDDYVLCKKTNTLRPVPEKLNYFDLFGIRKVSFKVDLKALARHANCESGGLFTTRYGHYQVSK